MKPIRPEPVIEVYRDTRVRHERGSVRVRYFSAGPDSDWTFPRLWAWVVSRREFS